MEQDNDSSRDRKDRKKKSEKKKKKRSSKRDRHDDGSSNSSADNDRRRSKKRSKKAKKEHTHRKSGRVDHESKDLYDLGAISGRAPAQRLTHDDYFDYHKHLWLYLYRTKGLIFDELSSDETRRYFHDFSSKYNAGQLPTVFYEANLPRQALDECQTTRHKWGFHVSKEMEILQSSVYQQTEQGSKPSTAPTTAAIAPKEEPSKRPMVGPALPPSNPDSKDGSKKQSCFDRAGDREKLDFRERRLLEKKQIGERTHGAHRDRDAVELTDDAVYGGDSSDFRRALEQEKRRNASRMDRKTSRIQELKEKEAQKQKDMMERLGLAKR